MTDIETAPQFFKAFAELCYGRSKEKGFWPEEYTVACIVDEFMTDHDPEHARSQVHSLVRAMRNNPLPNQAEKIALMHSELSEALEAVRQGNPPSEKIPEFSQLEEELADTIIRIGDFVGKYELRLGEAILAKLEYNAARPFKHNKQF